ncbi:MAG TPA: SDR family oxidoreductase, partial [Bryobacteraceae bacterium]|nr:SDR family oxidoreductase [Bryobacteraceae bacterium]
MRVDLTGKSAIVTGGANGIGRATAMLLKESGADVTIADLASERPAGVAASMGVNGVEIDVTIPSSIEAALDSIGVADIVVINAGIARFKRLLDTSDEDWNQTIQVNLSGAFHTLRAAAKRMVPRGGGSVVMTASTNSFDGESDLTAYNSTKAGLMGLLHTAANELGPCGIRVNAVCPGLIRTRLTQHGFDDPAFLKSYFQHIPLGRGGETDEVAQAIVFLASDAAGWITGETIEV